MAPPSDQDEELSIEEDLPAQEPELSIGEDLAGGGDAELTMDMPQGYQPEPEPEPAPSRRPGRGSRGGGAAGRSGRRSSRRGAAAEEEDAPSGRSGRRSSRRSAQRSAQRSAPKKAKGDLTPEEQRQRRKAKREAIVLVTVLVLIFAGAGAFYWFVMRVDPVVAEARNHLEIAESTIEDIDDLLAPPQPDPDAAEEALEVALEEHLILPMFADAKEEEPSPDNPEVVSPELAAKAFEIRIQLEEKRDAIERARQNLQAERNYRQLLAKIDKLGELPDDEGLVELQRGMEAFMDNPVEPEEGADPEFRDRFAKTLVPQIRNHMGSVIAERARRLAKKTTDVEALARGEAKILVGRRRFSEALSFIDELARNKPDADLSEVRNYVISAAQSDWLGAKAAAKTWWEEYRRPGARNETRQEALENCHKILDAVIASYGDDHPEIEKYLDEAKGLMEEFQPKG